MNENVLVPFDGSEPAKGALEYAFETFPDSTVTAFYVIEVPGGYWTAFEDVETEMPGYERASERAEEIVAEATEIGADHDRDVTTEIETGRPKQLVVDRAEEDDVDAIVIGSHGREGVSRILLGSVAEAVVRRSPVPVVVVR